MQGAPPVRYVSVSELYSTDEVELLLDEIRDLEPTSCRGEDVQDFEIAGSGAVEAAGGGGGGSPGGTELTERSWDSHAHYSRAPPPEPQPLAPIYCRLGVLLTGEGVCSACVSLCALSAAACVCAAGAGARGAAGGAGARGAAGGAGAAGGRVRLLQLAAITAGLTHAALLAVRITRLAALLPLPWRSLTWLVCAWSCASLLAGGGGTLLALLAAPHHAAASHGRLATLIAAASLGLFGALFSLLCAVFTALPPPRRRPLPPGASPLRASPAASPPPPRRPAHYRPVPSTSRDHAL